MASGLSGSAAGGRLLRRYAGRLGRLAALATLGAAAPAAAQTEAVELPAVEVEAPAVDVEAETGAKRRSASPQSTLSGEALERQTAGTLGATVGQMPGVHNSSFGPGVGLPVVRGLSGSRVRTMVNGMGTHDASSVSPDHAVAAEALTVQSIRVERGASTIRYGSGAIGGVVEVQDGRIPTGLPADGVDGMLEGRYETNGYGQSLAGAVDAGKDRWAVHVDAFERSRADINIPGWAVDEAAVRQQYGLTAVPNTYGYVPNTDLRASGANAGGACFGDQGSFGMSIGELTGNYGIPGTVSHSHGGVPAGAIEDVRIDMRQQRVDLRADAELQSGPVQMLDLRGAYVEYQHEELDAGSVATTFRNRATEGRLELTQRATPWLSGVFGAQVLERRFSALGAEAFVPQTDVSSLGGFLVQTLTRGPWTLDLGYRYEQTDYAPMPQPTVLGVELVRPDRSFTPQSWAATLSWEFHSQSFLTLTVSDAQRAPDVQELYAFGPHLATRTFDIGNQDLQEETIQSLDLGLATRHGRVAFEGNVFYNQARNFIYQRSTNIFWDTDTVQFVGNCANIDVCLPVTEYRQQDAELSGFEAQVIWSLPWNRLGDLDLTLFGDYVRGRFTADGSAVPRLPPMRYGFELGYEAYQWSAQLRYTHVDAQNDPGVNETPTAGYDLLNLWVGYRLVQPRVEWTFFVAGTNLLNQEIRNATSFLRSFAPEPGRSFELGIKAAF
jgi:iron complex outermembrane receptor protein